MSVAQIVPHLINGIQLFPTTNVWHRPILDLPVHAYSPSWLNAIQAVSGAISLYLKTSTASGNGGIPYNIVTNATPTYMPTLTYAAECFTGPFPIPASAVYEEPSNGGSDHHLLCLNTDTKTLYEMIGYNGGAPGAVTGTAAWSWDLTSNALPQPIGGQLPVAANAASLPMLAGIVFYDEIAAGKITHALYLALPRGAGYGNQIWPAAHGDGNVSGYPPEGTRFRLKASKDISGYSAVNQTILTALKTYGAINCDSNSGEFRLQGVPDARWNMTDLANLAGISVTDFEVVDQSSIIVNANSMQTVGIKAFSMFGV